MGSIGLAIKNIMLQINEGLVLWVLTTKASTNEVARKRYREH
ncbi:hypothetical protein [Flavivirga aquatica]|nr:hypothetical protein [Flavivirga aquatica]